MLIFLDVEDFDVTPDVFSRHAFFGDTLGENAV